MRQTAFHGEAACRSTRFTVQAQSLVLGPEIPAIVDTVQSAVDRFGDAVEVAGVGE
jgi:hypothetical protein